LQIFSPWFKNKLQFRLVQKHYNLDGASTFPAALSTC
jgi:hypothetical protein